MERIKTGIKGLDAVLKGGFPQRGAYVVSGECGAGKSIFTLEFLYRGATEFNEPGVYVNLEERKEKILANSRLFGWDLEKLEREGKFRVIPYIKPISYDMKSYMSNPGLESGSRIPLDLFTFNSLVETIGAAVKEIGARRVVIDPWTAVTLLSSSEVNARMLSLTFFEKLQDLDVTALVVMEEESGYWRQTYFLAQGVIHLDYLNTQGKVYRGLAVRKMRGSAYEEGFFNFNITQKGIDVIEQSSL